MVKHEPIDTLRALFVKKKVLDMSQILTVLNVTARYTAFRYLQKLGHLTSYTHNAKYYTLPEIAQFDSNGFWYFGDIGFSIHGTLVNTLHCVITESSTGKSNSELEKYCRTQVQAALRTLLESKKVTRIKPGARHIYVSADSAISERQIRKRTEVGPRQRLPDWLIGEVLIETIRACPAIPSIKEIAKHLTKRGSCITQEQVKQVFEEYELEKKTLRS